MKKTILGLGKTLNKNEQLSINGGVNSCPQCWIMTPKGCFLPDVHPDPNCNA